MDFNELVDYLESDSERNHFLRIAIDQVANEYAKYNGFEIRYPGYKEFLDMEKELARNDFSEWIAGVISGKIESKYENNVFTYLSEFDKDYYLKQAIDRFFSITGEIDITNEYENYKLVILLLYVERFPDNKEFQRRVVQNKNRIVELSNRGFKSIDSNVFYYLSVKNFGVRDLISQRLSSIKGKKYGMLEVPDMNDIDILINDFISQGRDMAQYFSPVSDWL